MRARHDRVDRRAGARPEEESLSGPPPVDPAVAEVLRLQAGAGNAAVARLLQRMDRTRYYNPEDDLDDDSDADDSSSEGSRSEKSSSEEPSFGGWGFEDPSSEESSSESEDDPRTTFVRGARGWSFDDVTAPNFRAAHVVVGPADLVGKGEEVAKTRKKPVSTSVLFTSSDQQSVVEMMRKKALSFKRGREPPSLQKQETVDKLLFVEFHRRDGDRYELATAGFGKLRFAAEGIPVLGGMQYEINHLDGMADVETT